MSPSDRDRVQRGLDLLREGLTPFVERELGARLGDGWAAAVDEKRREDGRRELWRGSDGHVSWDTSAILGAILDWWAPVFAGALGQRRRLVDKVRHVRNSWAHEEPFSSEEADAALDSMRLLLEAAGAHRQARRIGEHARGVLGGGSASAAGQAAGTHGSGGGAGGSKRPPPPGGRSAASHGRAPRRPEGRQGVYATLALMAGLAVLSLLAFVVLPAPSASGGSLGGLADGLSSGKEFFEDPGAPPPDLSFVCNETISYWESARLSADEKAQAQAAVEEFVLKAYGDPGADPQVYEAGVEPLVVGECFWASSPGSNADKMGEVARAGGKGTVDPFTTSGLTSPAYALDLVLFDPQVTLHKSEGGAKYLAVEGTAVWVVEGPDGELEGRQQRLALARRDGDEEGWKVFGGHGIPPAAYVTEYRQAVNRKIDELQYGV